MGKKFRPDLPGTTLAISAERKHMIAVLGTKKNISLFIIKIKHLNRSTQLTQDSENALQLANDQKFLHHPPLRA